MRMIRGFFCALFLTAVIGGAAGRSAFAGAASDVSLGLASEAAGSALSDVTVSVPTDISLGLASEAAGSALSDVTVGVSTDISKWWGGVLPAPDEKGEGELRERELYATAAVLLDANSGRVLYEKNANTPMAMASTTKIMTCILVLESCDLDDVAEVSSYAASMPKVKLSVKRGEKYRVRDLLYSLMLESHNDSAVVLAEHIGQQLLPEKLRMKGVADFTEEESRQAVKAFAAQMNEKARQIGCKQTWFITPNGLDATETFAQNSGEELQKEHSTTAAELARIMAYCVGQSPQKEAFREITGTAEYSFSGNGRSYSCSNHNAFLYMMDGAFSGKTGFTNKAGYCYVGALERDGRTFVVALLACGWPNNRSYKWSDTKKLMQYGLDHYSYHSFLEEGTAYEESRLRPVSVVNGQTTVLGDTARVKVKIEGRDGGAPGFAERFFTEEESAGGVSAGGESPGLLLREDEKIQTECHMQESLTAPVRAGSVVGEILYRVDGQIYFRENIVTAGDVEAIDFAWCIRQIWKRFSLFSCRIDR